jgi:hypothetical protein
MKRGSNQGRNRRRREVRTEVEEPDSGVHASAGESVPFRFEGEVGRGLVVVLG